MLVITVMRLQAFQQQQQIFRIQLGHQQQQVVTALFPGKVM